MNEENVGVLLLWLLVRDKSEDSVGSIRLLELLERNDGRRRRKKLSSALSCGGEDDTVHDEVVASSLLEILSAFFFRVEESCRVSDSIF